MQYTGTGSSVKIPEKLGGYKVTEIGADAFRANKSIASLTLPDGVVKIDEYAFYGCSKLASLTLGSSVKEIGTYVSGRTYKYDLYISINGVRSKVSKSVSIPFVSTPDITSRANSSTGIRLGWNKVDGVAGYAIFRWDEVTNGAWVRVATIEGNSTFLWTDTDSRTQNGTVFHYTVRALADKNGTTVLSGCRTTGRTMVRLFTPTILFGLEFSRIC